MPDIKKIIQFFSYLFLVAGLYYSTLHWLVVEDWTRDNYSHGVLIPFIVMYLLWEKKSILESTPSNPSWFGFISFIPGLVLFWLGDLGGEFFISYLSLWLVLVGLCWITLGWEKLKIICFPVIFALAMFPLPNFINVKMTFQLRLLATKLGVFMIRAYGMPVFREGNIINLSFTKLQVIDACSGLRSFISIVLLSILITHFSRIKLWKKVVIILSSMPLVILANALRIALTAILSEKLGSVAVTGFFHDFEGVLIFIFTLGVLLGEIRILNKVFPEYHPIESMKNDKDEAPGSGTEIQRAASFIQPQFVLSIVLLGLTILVSTGVEFREAVPISRSFKAFPMQVGEWQGKRQAMEDVIIDRLDLSDYIIVDFFDKSGREINFYVAYYESQRKGETIHSPATCLRGGGWEFQESGEAFVTMNKDGGIPVNRALIQKGSCRQISYYWFPMRGRILTNIFQIKWYTFWDALTRQRTDGALVRIIAPVEANETLSDAEKRLQSFVRKIYPVLSEYLPQ